MARYIDADLEVSNYVTVWDCDCSEFGKQTVMAVDDLHYLPTADVAPRAEWISVEERLPDIEPRGKGRYGGARSVKVLCACEQREGRTLVKEGYYELCGNGIVVWRIPGSIGSVTHWMPMPEPPKGKQPKDSENYEKKRLLPGDCFHGEIWCRCPYCFTGIEAHSIPKDRICHKCGKEYL